MSLLKEPTHMFYDRSILVLQKYQTECLSVYFHLLPNISATVTAIQTSAINMEAGIADIASCMRLMQTSTFCLCPDDDTPVNSTPSTSASVSRTDVSNGNREDLMKQLGLDEIHASQKRMEEILNELKKEKLEKSISKGLSRLERFTMFHLSEKFRTSNKFLHESEVWEVFKQAMQGFSACLHELGEDKFKYLAGSEYRTADIDLSRCDVLSLWQREADISSFSGTKWVMDINVPP